MRAVLILALLAPLPAAAAERAVTATEFAAMVEGQTVRFDRYGEPFGAEQYFSDGRVIWAFEEGTCQRGIWFENTAGKICFVYDSAPEPQCWDFLETDDGAFHARAEGEAPEADLVARAFDTEDLDCPLPDLGV
ncbi:hypothetical protein [Jannaschia sp. W003]|uniref:hypothetical protein n=1 Tax=Jannaschia sp. W003 TaxID=2867012 RepID=UPI0021A8ACAA|nr:hypothetical protein [Jannaschia sp. W003]UWQ22787.1 hypothetical protein K3554_07120 [Jannaschia sp. W003]